MSDKKITGLFFGSFNPIHIGHLAIANYMTEFTGMHDLWFVVSPQNPFKKKDSLLDNYQRLELVYRAINDYPKFRASDIEFSLPQPSYTINTLTHLTEKYTEKEFALIMGADNLSNFHKWKNHEQIIAAHKIFVYPRPGINVNDSEYINHPNIIIVDAPLMEISSSFIRQSISEKKDMKFFLPEPVYNYITEMHFYEK